MAEGLVGGEGFAVDASLIRADVHRQRSVPGEEGLPPEAVGRAVREYLEVLDNAAFGGATSVTPKRINLTDPASRWTAATREAAFYSYSTNYLIDLDHAVIVDVEATTSVRQAEVTAQRRMIDRTQERFGIWPERLGQILDYARALARFSYDDLQCEVSRATGRSGNALYQMVAGQAGALEEARFVDQVSRNLAAGRFLLMVVGDGITEGTQRIGEYLVAQPGLAFDFALVEMAQYAWEDEDGTEHTIVQPRLLAKTAVIERAVIRNEAQVVIEDLRDEPPAPSSGEGSGRKLDPALQQQWRTFAEKFIAQVQFDDPSQSPPRIGGLGWMKAALPRGHWITLWRSTQGEAGAYVSLNGSEGQAAWDALVADRTIIDEEFADAGLPAPQWERSAKTTRIALAWPAPLPWDEHAEAAQAAMLGRAANQLVNSFRPRLERIGASG